MGPLVTTSDAELSREEVQASSEASFYLGHPAGLSGALVHRIKTALDEQQAAETKKARTHTLARLRSLLQEADAKSEAHNAHARARIGRG